MEVSLSSSALVSLPSVEEEEERDVVDEVSALVVLLPLWLEEDEERPHEASNAAAAKGINNLSVLLGISVPPDAHIFQGELKNDLKGDHLSSGHTNVELRLSSPLSTRTSCPLMERLVTVRK